MTRLRDKVVAAGMWGAGLSWLAGTLPPLTLAYKAFGSHNVEPLTRVYIRGQVALTFCRWKAVVDPGVDPDGVYLFAQNHVNIFDHVTMYEATPHFKQGVELEKHFEIPFYGPFMKARGTLPVRPGDRRGLLELRKRAQAEVDAGRSLLVFPEGTRTRTGRVGPFKDGVFHLAVRLNLPVVPVSVTGMWEVLPTGDWVMRPFQEVTVHIHAPVPTADLTRRDVPELTARVHRTISDTVDAYYARRGGHP